MRKMLPATLAVALLVGMAPLVAEEGSGGVTIKANAINLSTGPASPGSGQLLVKLDRYSTDEERKRWRELFLAEGQEALVSVWQEENPRLGYARFAQTRGYQIRMAFADSLENGGKRVVIVTDRPFAGFELFTGARSQAYRIGLIVAEVDAEGKGEGKLVAAAAVAVKDGRIEIESYGSQPVQLRNLRVEAE